MMHTVNLKHKYIFSHIYIYIYIYTYLAEKITNNAASIFMFYVEESLIISSICVSDLASAK